MIRFRHQLTRKSKMCTVIRKVACLFACSATINSFAPKTKSESKFSQILASNREYSIPNQPQRFANAKIAKNTRFLDINTVYDPSFLKDKTVLVTGGARGLGRAITDELTKQGANVIITTRARVDVPGVSQVVDGVEVTDDNCGEVLASKLNGRKIDILINNAGYFYEPVEKLDSLNFKEELKMIDICAIGPLRVTSGLFNAGLLAPGCKIAMITSQGPIVLPFFITMPDERVINVLLLITMCY